QHIQPVRFDTVRSGRLYPAAASGRLAVDHGPDDVPPAEDEPAATGSGAGQAVPVHADHLHLHDGKIPGRTDHLLELEQHAFGRATMADPTTHAAGQTLPGQNLNERPLPDAPAQAAELSAKAAATQAAALEAGRLLFASECK